MASPTPTKKTVTFEVDEITPEVQAVGVDGQATPASTPKSVRFDIDVPTDTEVVQAEIQVTQTSKLPISGLDSVEVPALIYNPVVQAASTSSSAPQPSNHQYSPSTNSSFQQGIEKTTSLATNTSSPPTAILNPFTTTTLFASKVTRAKLLGPMVDDEIDEGEKDKYGNVLKAADEPCEKCGGRVVWATKGEWLLICEKCQEPQ